MKQKNCFKTNKLYIGIQKGNISLEKNLFINSITVSRILKQKISKML